MVGSRDRIQATQAEQNAEPDEGGVRANSRAVPAVLASAYEQSFRYFNSSSEVIRLVVMMYVRYPLSLHNVEDLLAERGIDISHETVRFWWNRFGPMFAAEIRKRRRAHAQLSSVALMEWTPPPDGIAMCQGGDVCRIPPNGEGIHEKS